MREPASMGGDTSADQTMPGGGATAAPERLVLGDASGVLDRSALEAVDAWWRAANYLSVGQIYLMDNPLLREPLLAEHVKPRLLGHFGTVPGLNLVWVHANRAIVARDLDAVFVAGPGHGGPGPNASAWLEVWPHHRRHRGHGGVLPAVFVSRRCPQPLRAGNSRLLSRGW